MNLSDFEIGDRVYVRWYGGPNMPCVVVEDGGKKKVEKEIHPGEGNGKSLRVGDRDVVEDPKPWGVTVQRLVEERGYSSKKRQWSSSV